MTHSHIAVQHLIRQVELYRSKKSNRDVRPEWVTRLIEELAELFEPVKGVARVGFDCRPDEGAWEISLYLGSIEVVGGRADGETRYPNFEFNLAGLCDRFERIDRFKWTSLPGEENQAGHDFGYITVSGLVQANAVRVHVYSVPPAGREPGIREYANGAHVPA